LPYLACLDCGRLSQNSRCPACTKGRQARRDAIRERDPFYASYPWRKVRARVLTTAKVPGSLDLYRCASCSTATARPMVDHIVPRRVAPALSLDPSNLRVVCAQCNARKAVTDRKRYGR